MRRLLIVLLVSLFTAGFPASNLTAQDGKKEDPGFPKACALWEIMYVGTQVMYYCDYFPNSCQDSPEAAYVIHNPVTPVPYTCCATGAGCFGSKDKDTPQRGGKPEEESAAPPKSEPKVTSDGQTNPPTHFDHLPVKSDYLYEPADAQNPLSSVLTQPVTPLINLKIVNPRTGATKKVAAKLFLVVLEVGKRRGISGDNTVRSIYVALETSDSGAGAPTVPVRLSNPPVGEKLPAGYAAYQGEYGPYPLFGFVRE